LPISKGGRDKGDESTPFSVPVNSHGRADVIAAPEPVNRGDLNELDMMERAVRFGK
jgi:hypothetical protein